MPRWDYKCPFPECPFTVEVTGTIQDLEHNELEQPWCPDHNVPLQRCIGNTSFTIKGYSAANGYSNHK
jgi:hypothetical protein